MLEVYFLRHGQTPYNAENNRYCGRTDVPLTALGMEQAASIHSLVADISFDAVYASPLERAYRTAVLAADYGSEKDQGAVEVGAGPVDGTNDTEKANGNQSVIKDGRLIEVDFGQWEGLRRDEFIRRDPASWEDWNRDPARYAAGRTGENAAQVIRRVEDFFENMLHKHGHGPGTAPAKIMVVAHNGVNRLYLAYKLGMPLRNYRQLVQDNSTLTIFTLEHNTEQLESELKSGADSGSKSGSGLISVSRQPSILTLQMLNGRG